MPRRRRAFGWASFGLGLAELTAPGWLEKQLGVRDHRGLVVDVLYARRLRRA